MRQKRCVRVAAVAAVAALVSLASTTRLARAEERTFESGSLIIPMDLAYQDTGLLQAYGLLFQLLRQGITVHWMIDPDKTWHDAPCDTAGDECAWDCAEEGSGVKCSYPTASPDFFAAATVVWDDEGAMAPGTAIANHGYRGGPFVIDAGDRSAALAIIDAWNDQAAWGANPWAARTEFEVVTVHEATAAFTANVAKTMVAAPTIAVFSDGNEDIATSYLRAAGIPQSNGAEFPDAKCGADDCGPGTDNPDMLTVPSIMGDMGTCDAPNYDHKNGSLFTADGPPAYCQIMSMHWNVGDRESVECDGGGCPATEAECNGETITYHGHEVVAEVRQFLQYPTHFFAECQAVNAYENTVPNPAWPFLDDPDRRGHFLTTEGMPPPCQCTDADFECVTGGCDGQDCCLPRDDKEKGAGFLIADAPNSDELKILRPDIPYNQFDGAFQTVGGSEPAYNLSTYLGTEYLNDREVTFITGPNGPGDQDVWMTGYLDGECDIGGGDDVGVPPGEGECNTGKVSYLGGHSYNTNTPIGGGSDTLGAKLFLNALFEADCVTSVGQPQLALSLIGDLVVAAQTVPAERDYLAGWDNQGRAHALDGVLTEIVPASVEVIDIEVGGSAIANGAEWPVGTISGSPPLAGDPSNTGARASTLRFPDYGEYDVVVTLAYRVGASDKQVSRTFTISVELDSDGDDVPDDDDPDPDDPNVCGDSDGDTCDDCSQTGTWDPANDGPDSDGDGICDAGDTGGGDGGPGGDGGSPGGCGCTSASGGGAGAWLLFGLVVIALLGRARRRTPG